MAENRLIGGYPVIGIRPTIDGRRGPLKVRESLEKQTMDMARAAKELFETKTYKLTTGKEIAYLSQYLATIKKDVEIDFNFEHTKLEIPDKNNLTKIVFGLICVPEKLKILHSGKAYMSYKFNTWTVSVYLDFKYICSNPLFEDLDKYCEAKNRTEKEEFLLKNKEKKL